MRELSVQAGNSTLSGSDRLALGEEMFTLRNEIDNIAQRVTFNGLNLLTGSLSTAQTGGTLLSGTLLPTTVNAMVSSVDVSKLAPSSTYTFTKVDADTAQLSLGATTVTADISDLTIGADGAMTISFSGAIQASITVVGVAGKTTDDVLTDLHNRTIITGAGSGSATYRVGAEATDQVTVAFDDMRASAIGTPGNTIATLVTNNTSVDSIAKANTLLTSVDQAIQDVSATRAKLGAAQNQIEAAVNSLGVVSENLSASESRIRDADIAQVSSQLVAAQIMQQAGVSVLSQANTSAQAVLKLLQNL
jgi:flagellin